MDRYYPNPDRTCRIYSASRRRLVVGQPPRSNFLNSTNFRINNRNFRPSYDYIIRDESPERPVRRHEVHEIPIRVTSRRYEEEDTYDQRGPAPSFTYYPPLTSPSPHEGEFHTVPVFSGPFPINHIPGTHPLSGRFDDRLAVLGPFLLHNIPYVPGAIPIHHIPYIPGPEHVPHCPVLYEPDENDVAYTYPGYSILVPVPYSAIPAVQMYILPSEFTEGPSHVLVFQHGYMLPSGGTHFLYLRDYHRPNNIPHMPGPVFHQYVYRRNERRATPPPPIGMRIGRQPPPPRPRRRRIYNTTQFMGPSFEYFRGFSRRSTGRSLHREYRHRHYLRTLHSCGSNDPLHNCLSDQNRRRSRTLSPRSDTKPLKVAGSPEPSRSESKSPENKKKQEAPAAPAPAALAPAAPAPAAPTPAADNAPAPSDNAPSDNAPSANAPSDNAPSANAPADNAPAPSDNASAPPPDNSGEGTSVPKRKTSRYRPSYNYLRNPSDKKDKKKIRNYDDDGNPVPTYRQAVHYCTKYHEKQSRQKFRKQRRTGRMVEERPGGEKTLFDKWVGDCTTTESDSDSSFITDEGGDETVPGNADEMLAYYYEIKALKDEEKKKKAAAKKKKAEEKKMKAEKMKAEKMKAEKKKDKKEEEKKDEEKKVEDDKPEQKKSA